MLTRGAYGTYNYGNIQDFSCMNQPPPSSDDTHSSVPTVRPRSRIDWWPSTWPDSSRRVPTTTTLGDRHRQQFRRGCSGDRAGIESVVDAILLGGVDVHWIGKFVAVVPLPAVRKLVGRWAHHMDSEIDARYKTLCSDINNSTSS